jgi:hypothetical protein
MVTLPGEGATDTQTELVIFSYFRRSCYLILNKILPEAKLKQTNCQYLIYLLNLLTTFLSSS